MPVVSIDLSIFRQGATDVNSKARGQCWASGTPTWDDYTRPAIFFVCFDWDQHDHGIVCAPCVFSLTVYLLCKISSRSTSCRAGHFDRRRKARELVGCLILTICLCTTGSPDHATRLHHGKYVKMFHDMFVERRY